MNTLNFKSMKTIKMKTIKLLALLFISSLAFTGCSDNEDDHDDDHDHEEEVITTLNYTLTNGDDVITLTYFDLDPDDAIDGVATVSSELKANTTYTGELTLLNVNDEDAEHIQEEIEAELEEHEFFYSTTVSGIEIVKTDEDSDGNPVGFDSTLSTGATGTGSLTIVLKHEPTKPNDDTSTNAGGSTDLEVSFPIEVLDTSK